MMMNDGMSLEQFIYEVLLFVILGVIVFVGIAWSHCPKGIIRTLIERKRSGIQRRNT